MANANDSIPSACEKCGRDFSRRPSLLVSAEPRAESESVCDECRKSLPAKSSFVLTDSAEAAETEFFDEVQVVPASIIRRFGPGSDGDGYKVSRHWTFRRGDLIFTLYDWKSTNLYDTGMWSPRSLWKCELPFDLHVGSKDPATGEEVAKFIDFLKRETSSSEKSCRHCRRSAVPDGNGNCRICNLEVEASEAFWAVIVRHFPEAKSGDLSPDRTIRQILVNVDAIAEWICNNVMPQQQKKENENEA